MKQSKKTIKKILKIWKISKIAGKNALLVLPIKDISPQSELSSPPRLRIQGGWWSERDKRTEEEEEEDRNPCV